MKITMWAGAFKSDPYNDEWHLFAYLTTRELFLYNCIQPTEQDMIKRMDGVSEPWFVFPFEVEEEDLR